MSVESWWLDPEQLRHFEERLAAIRLGRRDMLKVAAAIGGVTVATVSAACAPASTPTPAPSGGQQAAAPQATSAPQATTAPQATAPSAAPTTAPTAAPAATAAQAAAPKFKGGAGILRVPNYAEPTSFDFNYDLYCNGDSQVLSGLLKYDPDYKPVADMAEKWESNADGSVWTFHIRTDTKWSNGEPVTAHDFEWSWKRQLDPKTKAPYAGFLYDLKNAEAFNHGKSGVTADDVGIKAEDDHTLVATLEGPRGYFPAIAAYVAAMPAYRPAVEKYGLKWTEAANGVWNGPFKLTKWEHNKYYQLDKNENHWNAKNIKVQTVLVPIQSYDSWLLSYQNDELDWINRGPIGELKRVKSDAQLSKQMITFSLTGTWYLVPHVQMPPFDEPKVRLAMAHAINRDVIVNSILQGLGKPAYTMIPPGFPGYDSNPYPDYTKYDPKLAMDMLKGTKYEGGKNWPKITLTQRDEGDAPKAVADTIIAMLKQNLGMQIDHVVGEAKQVYNQMYQGKIQLMWVRWYADYPDPNDELYLVFYGKITSGHRQVWDDPTFDDLVVKGQGITDPQQRWAVYNQAQEQILKDGAAIFVYYPYNYGLLKPWVTGMPKNSAGEYVPSWNIFVDMYSYLSVAGH